MTRDGVKNEGLALAGAALLVWLAAAAVLAWCLPLLPIDETRYLTVAWEMREGGNWLLPTLNGEPYSHKPPLLFWLVNMAWGIAGPEVWAARLIPVLATTAVLLLTLRLGRRLYAGDTRLSTLALLLLTAGPLFLIYGNVIMFDMLLTAAVLLSLGALWHLADAPSWRNALLLGLALGFGLLVKGPVVLLHIGGPAFLIRFWKPEGFSLSMTQWWKYLLGSLGVGALVILSWAIPAAIAGGPEFAKMIFWKQSAGRMVNSFDHARPFYFYIPVVAAFVLPFLFWRPAWRAAAAFDRRALPRADVFLVAWMLPAFVVFSLMSGKQPHYLLPMLPGLALISARLLRGTDAVEADRGLMMAPFAVLFGILAAAAYLVPFVPGLNETSPHFVSAIGRMNPLIPLVLAAMAALALRLLPATLHHQALAMSIASACLVSAVGLAARDTVLRNYDLSPAAEALAPYRGGKIGFLNKYEGEMGYVARLPQPIEIVPKTGIEAWLKANPDATLLERDRKEDGVPGYVPIHTQPYRAKEFIYVLRPDQTPPR